MRQVLLSVSVAVFLTAAGEAEAQQCRPKSKAPPSGAVPRAAPKLSATPLVAGPRIAVPVYTLPAPTGYPPPLVNPQYMHYSMNPDLVIATVDAILARGYSYPGGPRYFVQFGPPARR